MSAPVQYSTKVDAVIYDEVCREFATEDFIALAIACLDQAENNTNRVAIRCALDHLEPIKEL